MREAWLWPLALLVAVDAPEAPQRHLRTSREVRVPAGTSGQTCVVLDGDVYAHAAGESLNDLRLFRKESDTEVPFTLTESDTGRVEREPATVMNLGQQGDAVVFDLLMPHRAYTNVDLGLEATNFVGSARVSGRNMDGSRIALGEFAVFDLSGQHLSRSVSLPLQESTFPVLHVELRLRAAPGTEPQQFSSAVVQRATVPPSRAAQTLYTTVATTNAWKQQGHDSVASLRLPAHVPVARVQVSVDPEYKSNFLRDVTVTAKPDLREDGDSPTADVEVLNGGISQVHLPAGPQAGQTALPIDDYRTSVEAVLAANLRGGASVEVRVANGDDAPLPLRAAALQMRQRRICFDASRSAATYTLMYGDPQLSAPVYDYSRLFVPSATPVQATLGPERNNPQFEERSEARPFTERHPELLWLGLLGALAALGGAALRGMRQQRGA